MEKTFQKAKTIDTLEFYSSGKLLLTGEYLVLKGAEAIGLKTKFGQSLKIKKVSAEFFSWTAYDQHKEVWLNLQFKLENGHFQVLDDYPSHGVSKDKIQLLFKLLSFIYKKKPSLFEEYLSFSTRLDFERSWGLGTSSTLVANLAKWSGLDAHKLLKASFGGSGYDIAIALENAHVLYSKERKMTTTKAIEFSPSFHEHIFFVYLNEKRNSREAIASFHEHFETEEPLNLLKDINAINNQILSAKTLKEFEEALFEHESILSIILNETPVKERLFPDYTGGICKSLGAWGGDFILVTGGKENWPYFHDKGFDTVLAYEEIIG